MNTGELLKLNKNWNQIFFLGKNKQLELKNFPYLTGSWYY